jgi:hypothetical protein
VISYLVFGDHLAGETRKMVELSLEELITKAAEDPFYSTDNI